MSEVAGGRFSSDGKPRRRRRFSITASTMLRSCCSRSAQQANCTSSLETRLLIAFMACQAGRPSFAATKHTVKISAPLSMSCFDGCGIPSLVAPTKRSTSRLSRVRATDFSSFHMRLPRFDLNHSMLAPNHKSLRHLPANTSLVPPQSSHAGFGRGSQGLWGQ